jgi:hypothetical protein
MEPDISVDVRFVVPYRRYLRMRLGEVEPAESIGAEGEVGGDIELAMVVAGLLDDAWFDAHPLPRSTLVSLASLTTALNLDPPTDVVVTGSGRGGVRGQRD